MHNMTGFLGAAVGVAIAVVIWVVVVSLRKERSGDAPQFDERQLAARAKAYSSAFFTLLGYLAVVALLDSVAEVRWCDLYTACFLGMMLALDVFAVAAIRSDAYFGIHERPVASIVLFAFVAVLNLSVAIARFAAGEPLLENGLLTRTSSMNLILGIAFVPVTAARPPGGRMKNLKLKAARAARDWSQQQLADAVGVSRQTIVAIEKGDYNPTIRLCICICQALGCTLDALFWPETERQ